MKEINKMTIAELRNHLRNLIDVENTITNNGNWWVDSDTNRHANLRFSSNRKEMQMVSERLDALEKM